MDKQEEQKEVSLPGAGGEERPSILEVLNRNLISECDNQVTDQQEQQEKQLQLESHEAKEDHHIDDDISHDEINDNVQLDTSIRYAASTQVTDLDADDNDSDKNRVFELESHLIAEDTTAIAHEDCVQVISELEADTQTPVTDNTPRIPSTSKENESVECDKIPFDNSKLSESNSTTYKLGDQRLSVIDNSAKRLSSVEERSNESESSCSDDNSRQTILPASTESDASRPWYQDDDLDPEDQRIIQEAVESILKDVKQQIVKDQEGHSNSGISDTTTDLNQNQPVISDTTPLQAPHLILSNPLFQQKIPGESLLPADQSKNPDSSSTALSTSESKFEVPSPDSGVTSPNIGSSHSVPQNLTETSIDGEPKSPVQISDQNLTEVSSPDSGITSPAEQYSKQSESVQSIIPNLANSDPDRPRESHETKENATVAKEVLLQPTPVDQPPFSEVETPENSVESTTAPDNVQQDNLILHITPETDSKIESLIVTDNIINGEPASIAKDTDTTPLPNTNPGTKSLPHETDEVTLVNEAKKEYYQRLREYLDNEELNRPPVPLKTYQWEDIRRSRKQGGYPWTHLYKRPLGPDEEPEILTLRKSQERQKLASESPKSVKKVVRIHDEVLVKETERYISELTDEDETEDETDEDDEKEEEEDNRPEDQREEDDDGFQHHESECQKAEDNFSVQSEPILSVSSDGKSSKITRIKGILKRRLSLKQSKSGSAPESRAEEATPTVRKRRFNGAQRIARCCHPIMNKLKSLADQKFKRRNIKKVPLKDHEKLDLSEKQKILKLRSSPKADHGQIAHFIEKQDSDEVLEILELEESPSKTRKLRQEERNREESSILVPDEIIELPTTSTKIEESSTSAALTAADDEPELDFSLQKLDEPSTSTAQRDDLQLDLNAPPERAPRRRRTEHIYEDIDSEELEAKIDEILQEAVDSVTRISQQIEEEISKASAEKEMEVASTKDAGDDMELKIVEEHEKEELLDVGEAELKSSLKRESSPGSDKRVTFSHTEDEAEPHREDIDLPEEYMRPSRSNTSDHEYEPIGQPLDDVNQLRMDVDKESSPIPTFQISEPPVDDKTMGAAGEPSGLTSDEQKELDGMLPDDDEEHIPTALEQQLEIEERYFSSVPTTPRTDSRTDNEIHTSQVDSSALEELPLKAENRRKGFMASAHDRSRKMSENIRSQAGKIRTKIRGTKKVPAEGSPKAKDRKRFKKPDFSKIKMPEIKRPDLSKFKPPEMPKFKSPEFKRPEFTKFDKPIFTKPDLSKFKIPDTMAIKLRRTRSLKETEVPSATEATDVTPESAEATPKKKFELNFGTYPRMLRKRKQKVSTIVIAKADDLPSTESPQSVESTPLPRQEGGPVSPRWTDKFSEVSYGDTESGKYQRYGSEVESLGRESSMERRMKEDLERSAREQEELEIIHSVEQKQFADFDEENRAIHEISRSREGEFKKRRPMVHQDSDLVSEESKDVGWSEKDALRNAILKGADDQDADHLQPEKYESEEALGSSITNTNQETQSTASSGTRQKGVIEEIDDDEFILRKRGISQDNIEIRQYISDAIREGLTTPRNTLAQLADKESYFMDVSNEQVNYGYDLPPPKPKRAIKNLNNFDQNRDTESREISQEYQRERHDSFDDNTSLPHDTEGYFANIPPNRPLRRSRKNFHRDENHEVPSGDIPYFDDEEDNLLFKKINIDAYKQRQDDEDQDVVPVELFKPATPPKAPKRRRKQQRGSIEKDSYANRFAGRSVSNSFLPSEERDEDFIVYRTQHEYIIPLAQAETFTSTPTPAPRRSRSRSQSHMTDDDRTSRGAESLMSESIQLEEEKFHIDMKDNDGYATVRKEPPPRPPAPRRHRKPSPLPNKHFATMPHLKKESSHDQTNRRRFGTIGPSRPPRRKSSASMEDSQNSPDVTQYEELDIDIENEEPDLENRIESPRGDLHSGDVVNKMKFRPLPPPPRPPRETRRRERRDPKDGFDDKQDKDDGAEMIACDLHLNGDYDDEKYMEKCIEVEASTQTDPLPDDFCCEEFEITDDMRVIEPRVGRTLQDILREDQHAQPDESFAKSIQRFREAGQRSFSERSKGSTADRSRTSYGSRPTTPSAIVLEKRVPTPIPGTHGETMLEAALVVLPIDDVDVGAVGNEVVSDPIKRTQLDFDKEDDVRSEEEKSEDYLQEEESRLITDHLLVEYETVQDSAEEQREISLTRDESPPVAPPRKRSSITTEQSPPMELVQPSTQTAFLPTTLEVVPQSDQQIERTVPLPSRLTLTDLEVERLNVHELQAGSITVSQLQSSMVKTDELECRSSNVAQPLEIPPGLIDEIVKRVLSSERASETVQTQTTEQPLEYHESQVQPATPETPPPPGPPPPDAQTHPANLTSESMQYSIPPSSFYTLRDPPEVELPQTPTHRRRRHHRRRDSSSDDESYREQRRSRHGTRSPEPSIGQLSGQLLQACGSSVMQSLNQIVGILRANEKEGNDRNISTAIALVIFVTIGFLLLGISGTKNIHHHHWDYFNPPDNKGR